jgi:hypothetical protein
MMNTTNSRRFSVGRGLALLALAAQLAAPATAFAHGGGGGHAGGFGGGGGGHMGGYGGGHVGGYGGGGFSGGRDFGGGGRDFDGGGRDFGGGREIGGERDFGGGREIGGDRDFGGGREVDGGGRLDGTRAGEFGPGHFAGDGQVSRADFQRIADRGIGGAGVAGRGAVRPYSATNLAQRGTSIRNNFYNNGWYGGRGWYANHFNPWWPGGWWGGFGWGMGVGMLTGLAWGDLAGWGGYAAAPVSYNYGSTVCYQDDGVYVQGTKVGTAEEYAQQAATLAAQGGPETKITAEDQWRSLGVFALARSEESNPSTFMSLAIDKDGLLRGSYYDAVSDSTMNITGKVDKKTQRAAWTIGDKKLPVYDAGLANLTQQQTTILVHRDGGKVEQMLLVRVQDKPGADAAAKPAPKPAAAVPDDDPDGDES